MDSNSLFSELSKRLAELSPEAEKIRVQLHKKIEQTLRVAFSEFGILTQKDFESQTLALRRAEARIKELEEILNELESRVKKLT
jgi:BMFP domain-containing protein YqiC